MGNDLDVTLALTRQQIEQRVSMGDRLDVPRAIEHSADFSRRPAAARAAESLRALGYEVTLVKRGLFRVSLEAKEGLPGGPRLCRGVHPRGLERGGYQWR